MNDTSTYFNQSMAQLRSALLPNAILTLFGFLTIIFSPLTMFIIFKSKQLHKKFFFLLAASAFADFLLGLGFAAGGLKRFYRFYSNSGEVLDKWQCCLETSTNTFSQTLTLSMAATLVVDRLLGALCPLHYHKMWSYRRVTLPLILSAWSFASVLLIVHITDAWSNRGQLVITCSAESSISAGTFSTLTIIQMIVAGTVVVGNVILAAVIKFRLKKAKSAVVDSSLAASCRRGQIDVVQLAGARLDLQIFKTISIITAVLISTQLSARLCMVVAGAIGGTDSVETAAASLRYARSLIVVNAAVQFLLIFSTSTDFRQAAKKVLFRETVVSNIIQRTGTNNLDDAPRQT